MAPTLENIRIASPCTASWAEMAGDDRVRFCGGCEKHVYNLSAMTRAEAEALIAASEGRRCVRYFQRADGTVLTSDCPEGVREKRIALVKLGTRALGLSAMLAGAALVPLLVKRPQIPGVPSAAASRPVETSAWMGKVATPPPVKPLMGKPARPEPAPVMGDIAEVPEIKGEMVVAPR